MIFRLAVVVVVVAVEEEDTRESTPFVAACASPFPNEQQEWGHLPFFLKS